MTNNRTLLLAATLCGVMNLSAGELPATKKTNTSHFLQAGKPALQGWDNSDNEGPNSIVKLNLTPLINKSLVLQYEYAFHKNMSGAIGLNLYLKRPMPGFFAKEDPTGEGLRNTALKGTSITPEFRFYPSKKEDRSAPEGFYVAAYLRYAKYSFASEHVENFKNGKTYSYDLEATYRGTTLGLMIGRQWLLGKRLSIDWWIVGGGYGAAKFKMDATGKGFIMNADEQEEVRSTVEKQLKDISGTVDLNSKVSTTSSSVKADGSGLRMLSPRGFGLCLGLAF